MLQVPPVFRVKNMIKRHWLLLKNIKLLHQLIILKLYSVYFKVCTYIGNCLLSQIKSDYVFLFVDSVNHNVN